MKHWVKVPGPGQIGGEGEWRDIGEWWRRALQSGFEPDAYWAWLRRSGVLPTHEGEVPPIKDEAA